MAAQIPPATYGSYESTGLDWLPEIPSSWRLGTIRELTRLKSEKGEADFQVLSVYRDYGVIKKDSRDDNHNATSLDTSTYKVVRPGDLVVNKMKAWQGSMGVSRYEGIVSPAYITCEVDQQKVEPEYLHYLLRSKPYVGVYNSISYGVRVGQWDMRYEDFKKIQLPNPSKGEQQRIAKFLDQKTVEIDTAIAKKKKLIELLKEQKAIVINQAVTKGLNPNAPVRDSGVEWIGEVPEHWRVCSLKILLESSEYGLSATSSDEGDVLFLNMSHVKGGKVSTDNAGRLPNVDDELLLKNGDILFNRTNSFELVGKSGLYAGESDKPVTYASYLVRLRTNQLASSRWLNYLMMDVKFLQFIRTLALRSLNQANLNPTRLGFVKVPLFDVAEQRQIADYLDGVESSFSKAIASVENGIKVLGELKKTIVAEAVTGRLKVS